MARDNGSRGSYRHVSANALKQQLKQEDSQPEEPLKSSSSCSSSPAGSDNTATPPTGFQNLKPDLIDHPLVADSLFDRAPDLLNVRFPVMRQSVPGSMPRPSLYSASPQDERDRVTWYDLIIANITFGAAAVGFLVIMYDGFSTIFGFLWGTIMGSFTG